jgi:DNA-binding NtrC family response regulator
MVVEDDPDAALYTRMVLEKHGCIVKMVFDPTAARAELNVFEPDVVITDIEMPGLTGLELLEQVRAERPGTPVVVMTAHLSVNYAVAALRSQADEFLTKPVASSDLISVVTRLAKESRRAAAAREEESPRGNAETGL